METAKTLKKANEFIGDNQKLILNVALLGLGAFVLFKVIKAVSDLTKSIVTDAEGDEAAKVQETQTQKELSQMSSKGVKPSYSDLQYGDWAQQLHGAFTDWFGTKESTVFRIYEYLKNDADLVKLTAAYGFRRIEYSTKKGNLAAWINRELTASELSKLNAIMAKNGITVKY